jgi:mannose-6-phosphate isomerase-like protein (cupin superfamily)
MQATSVVRKDTASVLDILGPTIAILSPASEDADYCMMIGTIPAGVCVPLHSHADVESFFVLSGAVQVLIERGGGFAWLDVKQGDFVHVPGSAKHAFRNTSGEPVAQLITTTPRLGRFFQETGKPVSAGASPSPPTPDDLRRFAEVAARYGHWLGSPAENAAIGITLFA